MSLIGEALKRARLEAARRDAEERGAVYSEAPAYLPQRRGLARWPAAGILVAGLALGLVVGTTLFLVLRRERSEPQQFVAPAAPATVAAVEPADALPEPAQPAPAGLAPTALAVTAVPAAVADPVPTSRLPAAPLEAPSARTGRQATAPAAAPFASGRSYLRAVELPSGTRLELDGIVASADAPLTMINRQLLSPGESVEGFTVERIEPNQVTLRRADGVVVTLRLRDGPTG